MSPPNLGNLKEVLTAPAVSGIAVTPNDSTDLSVSPTRGLWVGGAGTVKVDFLDGETVTTVSIVGVAAGTLLPFRVSRVYSTGTGATSIVALY